VQSSGANAGSTGSTGQNTASHQGSGSENRRDRQYARGDSGRRPSFLFESGKPNSDPIVISIKRSWYSRSQSGVHVRDAWETWAAIRTRQSNRWRRNPRQTGYETDLGELANKHSSCSDVTPIRGRSRDIRQTLAHLTNTATYEEH